ncbi:MAG: UDP-N-acetylmuramate dehydrogenase [Ilumatobacteraceae bacterium]
MIVDITRPSDKDLGRLASLLGDRAVRDEPLGPYTTYRVGGPAAVFVRATGVEDLHAVARALARVAVPVLVLGRGSNTLVADEGFRGLAVALGPFAERLAVPEQGAPPVVVAGGHASLPVVARQSVAAGLTGFEWAVGVPGSVGGAVRMNAGGHGSDMAASLRQVRIFDLRRGIEAHVRAADLGLRFRGSDLADDQVVLSATIGLEWGEREEGERRIAEIVRWRREHQPGGQNAGSVFVNPSEGGDGPSAGRLIDEAGLRGRRIGSAEVSDKHANFIQADEGGSADDVVELMTWVRQRVAERHGVDLRSEIRLVGFSPTVAVAAGHAPRRSESAGAPRRDAALDGGRAPDGSVPLPRWDESVPPEVLEELREAFAPDGTPTGGLRIVPGVEATPSPVAPPPAAAPPAAPPPAAAPPAGGRADRDRRRGPAPPHRRGLPGRRALAQRPPRPDDEPRGGPGGAAAAPAAAGHGALAARGGGSRARARGRRGPRARHAARRHPPRRRGGRPLDESGGPRRRRGDAARHLDLLRRPVGGSTST